MMVGDDETNNPGGNVFRTVRAQVSTDLLRRLSSTLREPVRFEQY